MNKKTICFLIFILSLSACASHESVSTPHLYKPVSAKIDTALVTRGPVEIVKSFTGVTRYLSEKLHLGNTSLRFGEFFVLPGETVVKGQLLVKLNTENLEKQIETQIENIARTQKNYEFENAKTAIDIDIAWLDYINLLRRATETFNESLMLQAENKKLEAERLKQNLELAMQRQSLTLRQSEDYLAELYARAERAELRAPYDGIITYIANKQFNAGVAPYETLVYIAGEQDVYLESIFEESIRLGANRVKIAFAGAKSYSLVHMPVSRDEQMFYSAQQVSSPVRFKLVSLDGDGALPELGVHMTVFDYEYKEDNALRIPSGALFSDPESGDYVYKMENGVKIPTAVEIIMKTETFVSIAEGLQEGDIVYVKP